MSSHLSNSSTYHFPGEGLIPEGRAFLQAEEGSTYRSSESSSYSGSSTRGHKVPLISETRRNTLSSPAWRKSELQTRSEHLYLSLRKYGKSNLIFLKVML